MKSSLSLTALGLAAVLLFTGLRAQAGDGHDHGDAAPAATGTALPRFAAVSETFELVGVLDGKQVTLYLDRFADNAPVRGAQIELEIAGAKFKAEAHGDDAYEVVQGGAQAWRAADHGDCDCRGRSRSAGRRTRSARGRPYRRAGA